MPEPPQENNSISTQKYDTCAHKSPEKIQKTTGCCGNRKVIDAHSCLHLHIYPLNPEICFHCLEYKNKNEA